MSSINVSTLLMASTDIPTMLNGMGINDLKVVLANAENVGTNKAFIGKVLLNSKASIIAGLVAMQTRKASNKGVAVAPAVARPAPAVSRPAPAVARPAPAVSRPAHNVVRACSLSDVIDAIKVHLPNIYIDDSKVDANRIASAVSSINAMSDKERLRHNYSIVAIRATWKQIGAPDTNVNQATIAPMVTAIATALKTATDTEIETSHVDDAQIAAIKKIMSMKLSGV